MHGAPQFDLFGTIKDLRIREYSYSNTNGSYVWPNSSRVGQLVVDHPDLFAHRNILELGAGTGKACPPPVKPRNSSWSSTTNAFSVISALLGILSIYLRKKGLAAVSSDYEDDEAALDANIAYNCALNGVPHYHLAHTWGQPFPFGPLRACLENIFLESPSTSVDKQPTGSDGVVDVIVASDILLYKEQYHNLINTLQQIFRHSFSEKAKCSQSCELYGHTHSTRRTDVFELAGMTFEYPFFLLNVARRLQTTELFYEMLKEAGFKVQQLPRTFHYNVIITLPRDAS